MPLYDYHCVDCDELFEAIRPVSARDDAMTCPACGDSSRVFLVMTGFATIATRHRWEPRSDAERLAGAAVRGPGASRGRSATSRDTVLHACAGKSCAYCG
jgi:putative FmdB family regulatory protein